VNRDARIEAVGVGAVASGQQIEVVVVHEEMEIPFVHAHQAVALKPRHGTRKRTLPQ
jgi:hypothetical protein